MEIGTFTCSICSEASLDICIFCTKDACGNHLCERCHRCSDCCDCELRVDESNHNGNEIHDGLNHFHVPAPDAC